MKLRILIGILVAAALGLGLWVATGSSSNEGRDLAPRAVIGPGETTPSDETELDAAVAEANETPEEDRIEVEGVVPAAVDLGDDPWADQLGGAKGRVVEEDGTPVADIAIALVQVDANLLLSADWVLDGERPTNLVLEETRTDDEGRFHLHGAYDHSFQGLGIDLRGPRSTVRVIDSQLHHGEVTDLGDIVLRKGCTVTGRVVDEGGAPAPGVRVRIVPAPPEQVDTVIKLGLQDFRPDCAVAVSQVIADGGASPVVELPPMVRQHLDDLPIPTVITDAEGRYRFEGILVGEILVAIDRPDFLGDMRAETTEPGEVELADFVLRVGRTVTGRVIDLAGEPVGGVEVLAGCEVFLGEAAFLHPAGTSASDGSFSVRGMPESGNLVAAGRRASDEPWVGAIASSAEELEIELEEAFSMTVHLVDLGGEPVTDAQVLLRPAADEDSPMRFLGRFMGLGASAQPTSRFRETEVGTYVAEDVTPGLYHVEARRKGLATVVETKDLWSGEAELTITLPTGFSVDVSVLDANNGDPVPGARASVVRLEDFVMMRSLAAGRTDKDGRVQLGPYTTTEPKEGGTFVGADELRLLVQHPAYSDEVMPLSTSTQVQRVDMQRGGEVHGTVSWGADPPERIYMLTLVRQSDRGAFAMFVPPRISRTSIDGSFRFSGVRPGEYRLEVYERWFKDDPIELLMAQEEPRLVHRESDFQVEPGDVVQIAIDLSPDGGGQTARLVGNVRLDGRPVVDAEVRVRSVGPWTRDKTDENGDYETDPFLVSTGEVNVRVEADIEQDDGSTVEVELHTETLQIQAGEVRLFDVDVSSREALVQVRNQKGDPIEGAEVTLRRQSGGSRTTAQTNLAGEARVPVVGAGSFQVSVEAAGYSSSAEELKLGPDELPDPLELVVSPAIPCAGICDLSGIDYGSIQRAYLMVQGQGANEWIELDLEDVRDDGRAPFEVDGLGPGEYKARFWLDQSISTEVPFELREGGDTGLLIVYAE